VKSQEAAFGIAFDREDGVRDQGNRVKKLSTWGF